MVGENCPNTEVKRGKLQEGIMANTERLSESE